VIAFISKRIFSAVLVLFMVGTITFFISHTFPGDPVSLWVGDHPTKEQLELANEKFGFDKPVHQQYFSFLKNISKFDLGVSLRTRQSVSVELKNRFFATFELVFLSMFISLVFGIYLGFFVAPRVNTRLDYIVRGVGYLGLAFPIFWLGMIFQLIFFGLFKWLPLHGRHSGLDYHNNDFVINEGLFLVTSFFSGEWFVFLDGLEHILLPSLTLSLGVFGLVFRTARSSMIDAMSEPFFKTFLAYGFESSEIICQSAYKNTLVPISTVSGLSFGFMLGGTFLVETIFDWPGLGHFSVLSVLTNDFPAIMGVTLLYALVYIIINVIIDILYIYFDPRLRSQVDG